MKGRAILVLAAGLAIIAQGAGLAAGVEVRWQPVERDVEGAPEVVSHYLLYFGRTGRPALVHHPADGTFSYDRVVNAGARANHEIEGLAPGNTWYFAVAAVDKEGNLSDYSQEVSLGIPDADGNLPPPPSRTPATLPARDHDALDDGCATATRSQTAGPALLLLWLLALIRRCPARASGWSGTGPAR